MSCLQQRYEQTVIPLHILPLSLRYVNVLTVSLCETLTVSFRKFVMCYLLFYDSHFFCMMFGFPCAQKSRTELFQKVCEVVEWGLKALEKDVAAPLPLDGSAIIDSVLMQVWRQRSLTTVGHALHLNNNFQICIYPEYVKVVKAAKTVYAFILLERQPPPSIKFQPERSAINRWTSWFKR